MGLVGRYIDSLNDEQRDRVIEHPDPTYSGADYVQFWPRDQHFGCMCLVATAEGAPTPEEAISGGGLAMHGWLYAIPEATQYVAGRFPELTKRFGAPRIWAVVKARAAKGHSVPAPARETVGAA